jgi:hypothetical protein
MYLQPTMLTGLLRAAVLYTCMVVVAEVLTRLRLNEILAPYSLRCCFVWLFRITVLEDCRRWRFDVGIRYDECCFD